MRVRIPPLPPRVWVACAPLSSPWRALGSSHLPVTVSQAAVPPGIQSIPLGLGRTQRRRGVPPPCDRPTPCFPGEAARPPSVGAAGSHTPTCGGGLLVSPHPRQHNFFVCLLFFFKYESLSRLRSFLVAQTSGPRLSKPNGLLRAPAPPGAGPGWKAGGLGPKHRLSVTFLPGQLGGELGVTGCLLTEETAPRPPGLCSAHTGVTRGTETTPVSRQ